MAHPHLKPCSLYLPAHKSSPPPLSWFSLQQRSFRSGNRGGKHVARSICKTVPYEGEPQLTLKFPVPIFHQTNQTAPKKMLEFLRLSQKKETKRHFVNSNWSTTTPNIMRYTSHPTNQKTKKKKDEFLESASPKALRSPGKTLHLEVAKFFWVGGRQSRICASVNFHSGYRRESLLKIQLWSKS